MKIVQCDNYNRETKAEKLVAENISNQDEATIMVEALQKNKKRDPDKWYKITKDDYVLWRGMEELI